jgi:crotonobetainyl-CoA:carnitine CoA-transferase CaiB-like acyl-CoA transferase
MDRAILKGVRVLDFTWMLAGPFASRILADFGAEVIKVESARIPGTIESRRSPYFNNWNRNKRSITLDMSRPDARKLVLKLAGICDVMIENFSPRVLGNWKLDYETLRTIKPQVIMVSMSAMGQTGPWRDFVAFGPTLHALSGLTYLTSFSEKDPIGPGYAHADLIAGLYGALAVLAALEHREKTGDGQYVDLSQYEATCGLLGPTLLRAGFDQADTHPRGNRSDYEGSSPYGCYPCRGEDRWCVIAICHEDEWQALSRVMGNPPWTKEDKFSTSSNRKKNENELDRHVAMWTVLYEAEEIVQRLQGAGVPAGVVENAEDLANDPHLKTRNFFVPLIACRDGKRLSDSSPIRFKSTKAEGSRPVSALGEDNRYVFIDLLGLTEKEFASYVERGIIA